MDLMGLTADEVARLVIFQNSGSGSLPMLAHGNPDPNTLINMGQYDPLEHWPKTQRSIVQEGGKNKSFLRDLGTVNNQVPQWGWLVLGSTFTLLAYLSYRNHKKEQKGKKGKR